MDHHPFAPQLAARLMDTACRHAGVSIILQGVHQDWLVDFNEQGIQMAARYGFRPEMLQPTDPLPVFNKMLFISDQPALLSQIATDLESAPLERNFSLSDLFEVTPLQINKASGLQAMVTALRLVDAPLVAVGDGHNDVAMLDLADLACVPDNGHAYLKKNAQLVFDRAPHGVLQPVLQTALNTLPLAEAFQRQLRDSIAVSG